VEEIMRTAGLLQQDSPFTDLQLFVPATQSIIFTPGSGAGAFPTATSGITSGSSAAVVIDAIAIAASTTEVLKFNLTELLVRTGMLKSNVLTSLSEQAFGTANGPGPNATFGTSDPSGLGYGEIVNVSDSSGVETFISGSNNKPPIPASLLATLRGPFTNNQVDNGITTTVSAISPKGVRIKWIDLLYQVLGVPLTSMAMQFEGFTVNPGHDMALAVLNAGFAVNTLTGAALAINTAHALHRERCTIVDVNGNLTSQWLVDGSAINAIVTAVTPAGSTAKFAGIIVGCDYNFN
jgi:hypothetical protein